MGLNNRSGNSQAEASVAWTTLAPGRIDPIEAIKELVQVLGLDRPSGILDAEGYRSFRLVNRYRNSFPTGV